MLTISLRFIRVARSGYWLAVCGVFFLVLYLTVQLTGIQILLEIAGYGSVEGISAGAIAFFLIVGTFSQSFAQKHQTALTRISVLLVAMLAFVSWATARSTLVGMLLLAANGAAQFLPGILLSFSDRRPSALSIDAALVVSLLFLCWTAAVKLPLISGVNVGLVALVLNFATVGLITLTSQFGQRLRQSGREQTDRRTDKVYCFLNL